MFNHILEDALFEVRRHWKSRILIPLGIIVVLMLVAGVAVGVTWFANNRAQPPAVNSSDIPLGSYAAGNIEVLHCIYQGEAKCSEYKRSKEWMVGATAGSLIYTPIAGDTAAPGEDAGGGTRRVEITQVLTDAQWHSIAAGTTLEGEANTGTVTENSSETTSFDPKTISATATFKLPAKGDEAPRVGTMAFTLGNSGVVLKSINYSGGE